MNIAHLGGVRHKGRQNLGRASHRKRLQRRLGRTTQRTTGRWEMGRRRDMQYWKLDDKKKVQIAPSFQRTCGAPLSSTNALENLHELPKEGRTSKPMFFTSGDGEEDENTVGDRR